MSYPNRKLTPLAVAIALVLSGALYVVVAHLKSHDRLSSAKIAKTFTTQGRPARGRNQLVNLSLQPEAFTMSRRLGARFSPRQRQKSIMVGTVTIGSERRIAQITRTPTDNGERVEINLAGIPKPLTWDAGQGAFSGDQRATASDRQIIERLVLDSPDQFVLAQLRGATYSTIGHNVRPANVEDNYQGPFWTIVRVGDPEQDETRRPDSNWRLYYINTKTGLIDRIESEVQGQRIVAEMSGWTDQTGEKIPTRIVWRSQHQTIMEYRLTNFSNALP